MPTLETRPTPAEVRRFIRERCVRRGDFTLASGAKSDVFFDLSVAMADPDILAAFADWIVNLHDGCYQYDAFGGPATGAIPLAIALAARHPARAFWTNDGKIDGDLRRGDRAFLLDDVVTSGNSLKWAGELVRQRGAKVAMTACIIDRSSIAINAMFTSEDILND